MFMLDNKGAKYRKVNLKIKDVGHRFIRDHMYDDQDSFMVCYDITSQDSFDKMIQICQ